MRRLLLPFRIHVRNRARDGDRYSARPGRRRAGAKLAPWTCGKSDEIREISSSFSSSTSPWKGWKIPRLLDQQEWYGKEQALKCLEKFGNDKLYSAAESLTENDNEFIREQAQRFAAQSSDPSDLKQLWDNALHEDWQVREGAIEAIGRSEQTRAIGILKKVIEKYPESAVAVLKASANSDSARVSKSRLPVCACQRR